MHLRIWARLVVAWLAAVLTLVSGPAMAADDVAITHVKPTGQGLQILVSLPEGAKVDLEGVEVTVAGKPAEATAAPADSETAIKRTTILAIDTSKSMKGDRFEAAQAAARTFLDSVPDDIYVGITTFAGSVTPALAPTLDRDAARAVLDKLELSKETRLYDGVIAAASQAGDEGQRNLLVLSDGADTSDTQLESVTSAIEDGELLVDVVALDQKRKALGPLQAMADAGNGQVISADPAALQAAFTAEADALARQVLVVAKLPNGLSASEGTVEVSLPSGADTLTASAFAPLKKAGASEPEPSASPVSSSRFRFTVPPWTMWAGVALLGAGMLVVLLNLIPAPEKTELTPDERVSRYTAVTTGIRHPDANPSDRDAALASAKEAAAMMLQHNQSLEARIAGRLEQAGSNFKPAEWLLVHSGIAVGAGILGMLLGKGSILVGLIFTGLGVFLPWVYLGFKRGRRLKAFNSSLPDTLQLMAGSLQAGLSLSQSVDTIVREGTEPIAGEFKRVLVETRLGVSLEDALEGITERFDSKDFAWVVMAIKIQRQVGGNLAELLNTVAGTIREREYMRRQVAALAAEGKLSAIVLGGLPPAFLTYLLLVNRDYVMPMFTDPRGWLMLGGGGMLLSVGIFWMSRMVKVEV